MIKERPRKPKTKIKINVFCNAQKAEIYYFVDFGKYLKSSRAIVTVHSRPKTDPKNLIKKAIEYKNKNQPDDEDQIWCVFDIDDFDKGKANQKNIEESIRLANDNEIGLAWSNECFELWVLLHFEFVNTEIPRKQYDKKLVANFKKLDFDYQKNIENIFDIILESQTDAIRNAKKLYKKDRLDINPSTSLHFLVEELLKFLPK